jgi:hypothetical protein
VSISSPVGTVTTYTFTPQSLASAAAWHHYRFVLRRDGNLPKCTVDADAARLAAAT